MEVRPTRPEELGRLEEIYAAARAFMKENGNPGQWGDHHPARAVLEEDVARGQSYVCVEDGKVVGTFCFFVGEEPTYAVIDGAWPDDAPYGVIHRLASSGKLRGVMGFCAEWALARCPVLRVDTHESNTTMRTAMARLGFTECGTIILEDKTPRIAFQKRRDCPIRECRSEEDFRSAGAVLSRSWQASHGFCTPEFLARHTPEERTAYLEAGAARGKRVFTLSNGGQVLGLVSLCGGRIGDLYVLPEAQGLGYGRRLLDFAIQEAGAAPTLWILENNDAARRFYEDRGFALTGRENRLSPTLREWEMALKA